MKKISSIFNDQIKYLLSGLAIAAVLLFAAKLFAADLPFNTMLIAAVALFCTLGAQATQMFLYSRQLAVKSK
jgi:hypothetical protein